MFCPSCGAAAQPSQKFCTECGAAIASAAAATSATLPPPHLNPPTPPVTPPQTPATGVYEPTAALTVVEQTSPTGYANAAAWNTAEQQWPAGGEHTGELPLASGAGAQPFRITPLVAVSALAAVLAVAAAFVDVASFEVTGGPAPIAQKFALNDFASNLTVGAIIAAVLLIGGSALGATGRRIGTGLAGGAGLALAGMFGMVIGQVTGLFDAQEVSLLSTGGSFTLTTTQEIGFWLAVVAAVLGGVAFCLSFMGGTADGRPPLMPAIGLLGSLGTLAVVVGPLIPGDGAGFGDNFSNTFIPPATLYLRLLVLVLIGIGGLVGFLANRRWGIGVALGAISIGAWQWITAITESGDLPISIAGGNPGGVDIADPFAPHIVTTIGVVVMLLAGAVGLVVAGQQRNA
jgi:hypothetical protein